RGFFLLADLFELVHLVRDGGFFRYGRAEQVAPLLRQLIELVAPTLLFRPGLLECDLRAEQLRACRGDLALRALARVNRVLVGSDDVTNVVPALDEVRERICCEEHVDVAQIAVLVRFDEPAAVRVVVPAQARLRGVELGLVRDQPVFVDVDVRRHPVEIGADERNVMVGLIELALEVADLRTDPFELVLLGVELEVSVVHLALMLADLLVDRRSAQRQRKRRDDEDESECQTGSFHARLWSLTQTDPSIDFACFLSSAAISPTCWYEVKARS